VVQAAAHQHQYPQFCNLLTVCLCCSLLQDVSLYQPHFISRIFWIVPFTLYNCSLTKYLLIIFQFIQYVHNYASELAQQLLFIITDPYKCKRLA